MARTKTYEAEPKARKARRAWCYFQVKHPPGRRAAALFYSPNVNGYGPGWIWELGHQEADTFHWKGGAPLIFSALSSSIDDWANRHLS